MSEMIESNAQNHSDDLRAFPYEVWHPEGEGRPPRFRTWREARAKQVEWNRDVSGHRARKRVS